MDTKCLSFPLLRLQVSIFAYDILDAGARLRGVEVMVTYDAGAGVTPVQVFKEPSHGSLLLRCPCVDFFATGIQTALIAYADAVLVVVHAVGADHPFRPSWFYASVTTDDVVVADALKSPVLMPLIYILCRTCPVGPYRTAMNNNQTNLTHILSDWRKVEGGGRRENSPSMYFKQQNIPPSTLHP